MATNNNYAQSSLRHYLSYSYYRMLHSDGLGNRHMSPKRRQEWLRRTLTIR